MTSQELKEIIYIAVNDHYELHGITEKASDETVLFGGDSKIDSMVFVNIIIDIENRLKEMNCDISLTSEKAMSRKSSPFKSVASLSEFIEEEIGT